ncbi:hypothetical protein GGU10DRAFT_410463 [Lentinula aff. detonsa]|uniref:Uncharacterized protein n=1 Tax=Lentinula aff. detonsa TaxID=2804958 RepID=A0AA38KPC3_9AGAR|nr:hypothetical protein GGU10DRAFT_410463 [Lentinula aff. detonsa]
MSSIDLTDVDLIANLVRRQGQELLQGRKDVEDYKNLHTTVLHVVSASKERVENVMKSSSHFQLQLVAMRSDLAKLYADHEATLAELEVACLDLRATLNLFHSGPSVAAPSEFPNSNAESTRAESIDGTSSEASSISDVSVDDEDKRKRCERSETPTAEYTRVAAADGSVELNEETVEIAAEDICFTPAPSPHSNGPTLDDFNVVVTPIEQDHTLDSQSNGDNGVLSLSSLTSNEADIPPSSSTVSAHPNGPSIVSFNSTTSPSTLALSAAPAIQASPAPENSFSSSSVPADDKDSTVYIVPTSSSIPLVSTATAAPQSSNPTCAQSLASRPSSSSLISAPSKTCAPLSANIQASSSLASVSTPAPIPKSTNAIAGKSNGPPLVSTAPSVPTSISKSTIPVSAKPSTSSSAISTPSLSFGSMQLSVASLKPICAKLPPLDIQKVAQKLCLQAIGSPQTVNYHIFKNPDVLFANTSGRNQTLITVSKNVNNKCSDLTKFRKLWKGHVLLQDSVAKHLYYLGEYESGVSCKLTSTEYELLPKKTKMYLFGCAKSSLPREIQTIAQLLSLMSKDAGIYIAKTELRFTGYSSTIESSLRQEAQKRGFV